MKPETLEALDYLTAKDVSAAFTALKYLETLSDTSDELVPYLPRFTEMIRSDKYVIRVRGFRLLCRQARWVTDGSFEELLPKQLDILEDPKPTAVRQSLTALKYVVTARPQLRPVIFAKTVAMNTEPYNPETMRPLIEKDIAELQQLITELGTE